MSTSTSAPEATTFAAALRAATMTDHQTTESAGFMTALMKGELDARAVARLSSRLLTVYRAIEDAGRALADDPIAGPFVDGDLERVPSLELDLQAILGDDWQNAPEAAQSPAADAYVARIGEIAGDPALFVAHHYTRYLGDLSGGQAIGTVLRRNYDLADGGASFYTFTAIEDGVAYKRGYRDKLNHLGTLGVEVEPFIAEVKRAYSLNGAMFAELDGLLTDVQ
jgi:heme oxygenase